ncbi:unnamed protein product [Effrenium voratum]|uniref:EF-hand domain-containing protein n=1 Tax=Effrenium voratum TaxID=2562239 RepID=A0AA36JLL8_9DINO|nr:unnamed protein product [Effrenium voratum]
MAWTTRPWTSAGHGRSLRTWRQKPPGCCAGPPRMHGAAGQASGRNRSRTRATPPRWGPATSGARTLTLGSAYCAERAPFARSRWRSWSGFGARVRRSSRRSRSCGASWRSCRRWRRRSLPWKQSSLSCRATAWSTPTSLDRPMFSVHPRIELRNLEAEALVGEAQRLEEEKQKRKERLEALTAQADEIEFWLDAAGHAPVGPEGRARVERFKAAAQAAAEAAERPVEKRHSASAALYSVTQWKEFFQGEELADGEQQELETFFARIDPGRPLTGAEVTAAAGNPQIGLPRQLRGLLAKVASKHAAGAPSQAEAQVLQANAETQPSAEVQAQPSSAQTPSAVQTPGDTAKAPEVQPSPAQKPSAVQPPGDTTQAPEVQPSPASAPSAAHTAQAEVSPSAAQTPQTAAAASAEEDGNFTVGEWIDFFQEEGALDDKERRELEQKCKAIESPEKGRSMEDMRSALSGLGLSPRLEEKLLKILAAAEAAEEDEETNFSKQEWMDFFQEDEDISAEELPVLDKLLDQMDTSGDGQISAEEITAALNDQSLKMPAAVRAKLVEFMQNVG